MEHRQTRSLRPKVLLRACVAESVASTRTGQTAQRQNTCPLGLTQAVDVKTELLSNQRFAGHMTP